MTISAANASFNLAALPADARMKIEGSKHGWLIHHKLKGLTGPIRQARGKELLEAVPVSARVAVAAWLKGRACR